MARRRRAGGLWPERGAGHAAVGVVAARRRRPGRLRPAAGRPLGRQPLPPRPPVRGRLVLPLHRVDAGLQPARLPGRRRGARPVRGQRGVRRAARSGPGPGAPRCAGPGGAGPVDDPLRRGPPLDAGHEPGRLAADAPVPAGRRRPPDSRPRRRGRRARRADGTTVASGTGRGRGGRRGPRGRAGPAPRRGRRHDPGGAGAGRRTPAHAGVEHERPGGLRPPRGGHEAGRRAGGPRRSGPRTWSTSTARSPHRRPVGRSRSWPATSTRRSSPGWSRTWGPRSSPTTPCSSTPTARSATATTRCCGCPSASTCRSGRSSTRCPAARSTASCPATRSPATARPSSRPGPGRSAS